MSSAASALLLGALVAGVAASPPAGAAGARGGLAPSPQLAAIASAARSLEVEADGFRHAGAAPRDHWRADEWEGFEARAAKLSTSDVQAQLARRDGDVERKLRRIGRALPQAIAAADAAKAGAPRKAALDQVYRLLRENGEVIAGPTKP